MSYIGTKDYGLEIARGNVTGSSLVHKFGAAPDFDTGDNEIDITDLASDGAGYENMSYTYSSTAAIDSISSTDAGDSVDIEVQGLDSNYDLVTQTATLNGQTRVALTTSLIRVFRMKNVGSTDLAGTVVVYENDTTTGGLPDDATLIRGAITIGNNQTEMAVYTIPNGYSGYLRGFYVSIAGVSRTAEYLFKLKARPDGQVFQLKHKLSLDDAVSTNIHHIYTDPQKFSAKTDLVMTCDLLTAAVTGASVIAGFDIVLVQD